MFSILHYIMFFITKKNTHKHMYYVRSHKPLTPTVVLKYFNSNLLLLIHNLDL